MRETTSLCPECFEPVEAAYVEQDGAIQLRRDCPDHGEFAPVIWRDADHFEWTEQFAAPRSTGGLAVANSHACLAVLEVTTRCNLECSYCFASSSPRGADLSMDEIEARLDAVLDEGGPRPLQLSGGEPTVHPKLPEIVRAARDRGFEHIEVNSNGIRLAEDGYAQTLADAGVEAVYLQFDGLQARANEAMRGADLIATKREAIRRCHEAGIPVVLACTVVESTNADALGDVVDLALDEPGVRAVNFQPLARFGRYAGEPDRLSLDAVARLLADQTPFLRERDFVPVPCCSPRCHLATVLLPRDDGAVPLTRFLDDDAWAETGEGIDESAWMEVLAGTDKSRDPGFLADCCGIDVPAEHRDALDRLIPVGLVGFMDAGSADLETLQNCCIAVPTPDGLVPFCAYQMTDADGDYAFRKSEGWPGRREVSGSTRTP